MQKQGNTEENRYNTNIVQTNGWIEVKLGK